MKKNYTRVCLLVSLAWFSPSMWAQTQPAAAPDDRSNNPYPLTIPDTQQGGGSSYVLSGTSISGTRGMAGAVILTEPVSPNAGAYKTESGIYFYPSVFTGLGYDSNLLTTNADPVGSSFIEITPKLLAELRKGGDRYTALVSTDSLRYSGSSGDNVTNTELAVAGDNYYTARARSGWAFSRVHGSDPRGSTNRPIATEPDRYDTNKIDGRFIYGAPEASGRIEVDVGNQRKVYSNNRTYTELADVSVHQYAGRVFLRISPRTLTLLEYRNSKAIYDSALANTSSTEQRYYVGLTWEASAATTGIVKFGRLTKAFSDPSLEGFGGSSWEAAVRWMPRTYTAIDLQTTRATGDTTGVGRYTLTTGTNLIWNQQWSSVVTSRIATGLIDTDFVGAGRKDSTHTYSFTLDYALRRWLKLGLDVTRTNTGSTDDASAYNRTVSLLTLTATL